MESSRYNLEAMEEAPSTSGRRVSTPRHRGGGVPSHNYNLRDRTSHAGRVVTSNVFRGAIYSSNRNRRQAASSSNSNEGMPSRSPQQRGGTATESTSSNRTRSTRSGNGAPTATANNAQVADNTSSTETATRSEISFGKVLRGFFLQPGNVILQFLAAKALMIRQAVGYYMPALQPRNVFRAQPRLQIHDNMSSCGAVYPASGTNSHDNELHQLRTELKILKDVILSESKCAICLEMFGSEIYACENGHTICHDCKPRVTECPHCRADKTTRARSLEAILEATLVFCPFQAEGCRERTFKGDLETHKINCCYN